MGFAVKPKGSTYGLAPQTNLQLHEEVTKEHRKNSELGIFHSNLALSAHLKKKIKRNKRESK